MANGPDGKRFVWGRVEAIHEVGPYAIVEYQPSTWDTKNPPSNQFHPYVNGQDIRNNAPTLDGALCLAIAFRNGDIAMARAMMKLVAP